jgi:hypothetical protein
MIICISDICCNFLFFTSNFINFDLLSFFFSFWEHWDLNSRPCTWWAADLPLEPHSQPFLLFLVIFSLVILVIFQIWCHIFFQVGLDHDLPIYAFHVAGMTGACHHTQLYQLTSFCQDWPWTVILPISAFSVAGITGINPPQLAFLSHLVHLSKGLTLQRTNSLFHCPLCCSFSLYLFMPWSLLYLSRY